MDAYLSTEKKPLAKKFPFYNESQTPKSNFLEQSGGGGWKLLANILEISKNVDLFSALLAAFISLNLLKRLSLVVQNLSI